jgi:hypothetical protein
MDGVNIISGANVGFNPGPSWHALKTGDYNSDGESDILWQNDDGTARWPQRHPVAEHRRHAGGLADRWRTMVS